MSIEHPRSTGPGDTVAAIGGGHSGRELLAARPFYHEVVQPAKLPLGEATAPNGLLDARSPQRRVGAC